MLAPLPGHWPYVILLRIKWDQWGINARTAAVITALIAYVIAVVILVGARTVCFTALITLAVRILISVPALQRSDIRASGKADADR